jgi:hypothetical protein
MEQNITFQQQVLARKRERKREREREREREKDSFCTKEGNKLAENGESLEGH